jgi:hypothetical protein
MARSEEESWTPGSADAALEADLARRALDGPVHDREAP